MNIPQNQYLRSQSFNSKFAEFVWQFPEFDLDYQVIFIAFADDGLVYQEEGYVDALGEYTDAHLESSKIISNRHLTKSELESLRKAAVKFIQ